MFLKFRAIWGEKWTKNIDDQILPIMLEEWAIGLKNLSGEDIKFVLDYARGRLEWPPSIAEFIAIAKSRKGSYQDARDALKSLDAPREYVPPSPLLAEYMAKHPETCSAEGIANAKEWMMKIRRIIEQKESSKSYYCTKDENVSLNL